MMVPQRSGVEKEESNLITGLVGEEVEDEGWRGQASGMTSPAEGALGWDRSRNEESRALAQILHGSTV